MPDIFVPMLSETPEIERAFGMTQPYDSFSRHCKAWGLPVPEREVKFHPTRKWRFDYAWVNEKVAVEVEGGIYSGGRHVRGAGYEKDMEKYNHAQLLGWTVLRYTPQRILDAIPEIADALA